MDKEEISSMQKNVLVLELLKSHLATREKKNSGNFLTELNMFMLLQRMSSDDFLEQAHRPSFSLH